MSPEVQNIYISYVWYSPNGNTGPEKSHTNQPKNSWLLRQSK